MRTATTSITGTLRTARVWGGITDLHTGKVYTWNAATLEQVAADLRKLRGITQGKHWDFENPREPDVLVLGNNLSRSFQGPKALKTLRAEYAH